MNIVMMNMIMTEKLAKWICNILWTLILSIVCILSSYLDE